MESTSAAFAGTVFAVFGTALLLWTGRRAARGESVVIGSGPAVTAFSALSGVVFLLTGGWLLSYL